MTLRQPLPQVAPVGVGQLHGTSGFAAAARIALGDEQLRRNLDHATTTIRNKRAGVVAEVDDWEVLRDRAEAIKTDTMARLPQLLTELERNVAAAGGVVHWARDAHEANAVVTRLVAETGSQEVVKVKSMATQEIGLNEALEAAGVHAIETDLAELIVQLADDRPSHILVPAIHRNRTEIRDLFVKTIPGTDPDLLDEPRQLAATARRYLREKFLTARVGISGANFAVAETGTLVVVESEGNGRMCLTLPETLISVVGIEKLLPRWDDLSVFLQLLPRSSTGERMNPYTSLWTGVHAGDGPSAFHLVLVDNGRTAVLADPVGRQALHCIRCSACLNVCPVYERTGGHAYGSVYPGPIGAILTPQLTGIEHSASLPYASSLCGACYDVCPVKIDIPKVLVHLRNEKVEHDRSSRKVPSAEALAMAAAAWTMADPRRWSAAQRASRVARLFGRNRGVIGTRFGRKVARLPGPLAAWLRERDAPRPPDETFRDWWRRTRGHDHVAVPSPRQPSARHATDTAVPEAGNHPITPPQQTQPAQPATATTARDVVLQRIRQSLADPRSDLTEHTPDAEPPDVLVARHDPSTAHDGSTQLAPADPGEHDPAGAPDPHAAVIDLFIERVDDYRAAVHRIGRHELADLLVQLVSRYPHPKIGVPEKLDASWCAALSAIEGSQVVPVARQGGHGGQPHVGIDVLETLDVTVTAATAAIAETGTIILDGSPRQGPRALTLVPDHHVCVVAASQIHHGVHEALTAVTAQRPLTLISGPSATSDIELDRVEGVHGPRTLDVVVVTDA